MEALNKKITWLEEALVFFEEKGNKSMKNIIEKNIKRVKLCKMQYQEN